jgi:cytochrome c oxidase cbb3-type subunit 3
MKWLAFITLIFTLAACSQHDSPTATGETAVQESVTAGQSVTADAGKLPPSVRYPDYPSAGDEPPPAVAFSNPLEADAANVQAGATLFTAMNCDGCHGGGGFGVVGPSLIDGRWRYGGDDGAVFQSIYYGRPRGMPAYGGMINETVVWQLISYLRAQPQPEVVPTLAWVE